MQVTVLANGKLQLQDPSGFTHNIGPEHPEYPRLMAQLAPQPVKPDYTRIRLFALVLIAVGIGAWWYNWHTAATVGTFSLRLNLLGPAGLFGGLLMLARPDWSGRMGPSTTRAQKVSIIAAFALIAISAGINFYLLDHYPFHPARSSTRAMAPPRSSWSPQLNTVPAFQDTTFLGRALELKSFHEQPAPTWEFGNPAEPIDNWTTLLTLIDRTDAHTIVDLDRLAEGIQQNYKSHGGRILMAKTMQDAHGAPYNYMVAAFDQPAQSRYELNFVKMSMGPKNAIVAIYGARIAGADYKNQAKQFLDTDSSRIGDALAGNAMPDLARLPRKEF